MERPKLSREGSLYLPEVKNPFEHKLRMTWADKLQILLMSLTIVPLKLVLVCLLLSIAWGIATISLMGRTKEEQKEPMRGWRKSARRGVIFFGRAAFFVFGFYRIEIKGKQASSKEAPVLIFGPHTSYIDTYVFFMCGYPSAVSRVENLDVPLIGTLTRYTQPVFVSREDPNSRQNTIKEIKKRAQSNGKWPQVAIFPEGTCTNRSCLISFKPGAFYPGVAVQPVCIRYNNRLDTITWTWEGINAFQCLWYSACQWTLKTEIEFLPVYKPSQEEIEDPRLFASNVRAVMAKAMNVPTTDHTYEDIRLMKFASTLDLPAASGLVEFSKLNKKLGVTLASLKELLERFGEMAQNCNGHIDLETFAKYLDLPVSQPLKDVFELYDRDGSGKLDFREYVIGLSLIAMPANNDSIITLAFKLFDHGNKGYIEEKELKEILTTAFGLPDLDAHQLFVNVDADRDGKITYDEFKKYAEMKPEYASIFCRYQEINSPQNLLQTMLQCPDVQGNGIEKEVKVSDSQNEAKVTQNRVTDIQNEATVNDSQSEAVVTPNVVTQNEAADVQNEAMVNDTQKEAEVIDTEKNEVSGTQSEAHNVVRVNKTQNETSSLEKEVKVNHNDLENQVEVNNVNSHIKSE